MKCVEKVGKTSSRQGRASQSPEGRNKLGQLQELKRAIMDLCTA